MRKYDHTELRPEPPRSNRRRRNDRRRRYETGRAIASALATGVATGAGSGFFPIAPGTAGSLVGLLVAAALRRGLGLTDSGFLASTALVIAAGVWAAGAAGRRFGNEDDGRITIDEIAGQLVALACLPVRLDVYVVAFLLFRLFDIAKPPPCRSLERLPSGLGVMADDLMAGVYANLLGQLLWRSGALGAA